MKTNDVKKYGKKWHLPSVFIGLNAIYSIAIAQSLAEKLDPVTVTATPAEPSDLSGIEGLPIGKTPIAASAIDAKAIQALGAQRLNDLFKLDASLTDAYNTAGYVDYVTARGYVLDNRFNYRREGLPINAETSIALFNKERVAILKGTSGLQTGTSAPGGLVDYRVKRPTAKPVHEAYFSADSFGAAHVHVDFSERFGPDKAFGLRANAALEKLNSPARQSDGSGQHAALALQFKTAAGTFDVDLENSRRSQPSVPGVSLLGGLPGDALPKLPKPDAKLNINTQPWSQPVVFRGTTASLQWEQNLSQNWTLRVQHQRQNLKNDDRVAFPFGCFDAARDTYYADRYCPDGSADLYDFRSDNERRNTQATQIKLNGNTQWGAWQHRISAQAMRSSHKARFQDQAYNAVGTVNIYAPRSVAADPTLTDVNTNRDESSREFALTDAANIGNFTAWLGVRHTQLNRSSVRTDGSRPLRYEQNITTPWLAASYQFTPELMAYASFGQGAETDAAPNRARYTNRGQVLATLKSQQSEFGVKHASTSTQWSMALFRIKRPVAADIGTCSGTADCTRQFDGSQDHTGVELTWAQRLNSQWQARTSASFIHAKRSGSAQTGINGLSPTNVPRYVLLAGADWQIKSGLKATVDFSAQGERFVLPDNSLKLPAWQRVDVRVEHRHRLGGQTLNWTAGIDNLLDQRRFQESPYQFGHSYLFTAAPRSLRLNMALAW